MNNVQQYGTMCLGKGGKDMNILIACEESQTICKAFRAKGFNAFSCDLKHCSGGHPEWHIKRDVRIVLDWHWDLIIAHPPCTYLSRAGARWLYQDHKLNMDRYEKLLAAKDFFLMFYDHPCKHICIENPTPFNIAELPMYDQVIQPYEYGAPYSKRTLLWLKNLPLLKPTKIIEEHTPYVPSNCSNFKRGLSKGSYGACNNNSEDRSKTFVGIAEAMADQWGDYLREAET